jgi:hemerythrin-like metal-binding protein
MQRREEPKVGIASLDEQHHTLMAVLDAFQAAVVSRRSKNHLRAVADLGLEYLKGHFAHEEELGACTGCLKAAGRCFQHRHLMLNATSLANDALNGTNPPEVLDENVDLLRQMFLNHVAEQDSAPADHLKRHGTG